MKCKKSKSKSAVDEVVFVRAYYILVRGHIVFVIVLNSICLHLLYIRSCGALVPTSYSLPTYGLVFKTNEEMNKPHFFTKPDEDNPVLNLDLLSSHIYYTKSACLFEMTDLVLDCLMPRFFCLRLRHCYDINYPSTEFLRLQKH